MVTIGNVGVEINIFNLPRDLSIPRDQIVMWLCRQQPLEVSHHPPKVGGHGIVVREI